MAISKIEQEIISRIDDRRSQSPEFVEFATWGEVIDAARRGNRLWYLSPMNPKPSPILVKKVFKNGKIRIDPLSSQTDDFTADSRHLNRFRQRSQ